VRARNQRRRGGTNCVKKIEPNLYNAQQYKQQKNNNALSSKSEPYFQGDKTTATRQISSIHLKKEVLKMLTPSPLDRGQLLQVLQLTHKISLPVSI
jgi:hypothetical protein